MDLGLVEHPMKKIIIGLVIVALLILGGVVLFKRSGGESQAAALAPQDTVVFVNIPNIPRTGFRWIGTALAQIAADPELQAFLEQVVQGPAVLVGHSLGGLVALSCAVFFPQLVRGVVAAPLPDPTLLLAGSSSPPRRRPWQRRLQRWLVTLLCRLLPLELLVPLIAHSPLLDLGIQSAYSEAVIGDRDLHRLIARPARRPGAVRALRAMSIAMALRPHGATAPALLRRLGRPLLLIWGQRDRLVPVQVAQQVRRLRPELPLTVLPGSGHCPHDEHADAFNAALLQWLDQLPAAETLSGPGR